MRKTVSEAKINLESWGQALSRAVDKKPKK